MNVNVDVDVEKPRLCECVNVNVCVERKETNKIVIKTSNEKSKRGT